MKLRRLVLLSALLVLVACGGDDEPEQKGGRFDLSDGTRVVVSDAGQIEIFAGERRVYATAPGAGVQSAAYEQSVTSLFGMWNFTRSDEQRTTMNKLSGAKKDGDAVLVTLSGPGGSTATVRVAPHAAGASLVSITVTGVANARSIAAPFDCDAEASFFGFGEQYNTTNQRGEAFPLFVSEQGIGREGPTDVASIAGNAHTTYFPMPYFLDARGFGALARTDARVLVDLCKTDPSAAWLEAESAEPLEIIVFHGPTGYDVIRQLGDQVGRPARPPSWAFGAWIAAQGGQTVVEGKIAALEAAQIPFTAIWSQDWTGPRTNAGGGSGVQYRWVVDPSHYPDLKGLIDALHAKDKRFLGYVNPFVMPKLEHFAEMDVQGLLIQDETGKTYRHASPAGDASHPDFGHEPTRAYVRAALAKLVTDYGMDGWMADFAEWVPIDVATRDGSDGVAFHNRYPEAWHRASREVFDQARPSGDWAVFTRSGWSGDHAVAQIVWAGDQEATWSESDGLPTVVPALLNLSLSGLPFVTHDIAGFSGGPSDKELFQRWTELGAFTPIFRTHEGNLKDQNWSWDADAETTAHFRRFVRVHDALRPELEALADEAAKSSKPIVRHLMLEFPDDAESRTVHDQFLVGSDLLIAPVVAPGANTRSVYFPPGKWFDVWTGQSHDGPARVDVPAPVGSPPVFSRDADRTDLRAIQ